MIHSELTQQPAADRTPTGPHVRRLRRAESVLTDCLDRLDDVRSQLARRDLRCSERVRYRAKLFISIEDEDGSVAVHEARARDLSPSGIGLIVGQFIYPETLCRLNLVDTNGQSAPLRASVMHCRYIPGTACLYRLGLRFDRTLDPPRFAPTTVQRAILMIGSDNNTYRAVCEAVAPLQIRIPRIGDPGVALQRVGTQRDAAVLIDLDTRGINGMELAQEMRRRDALRAIAGLTADERDAVLRECLASGFDTVMHSPPSQSVIRAWVASLRDECRQDACGSAPELADALRGFVAALPPRVRELERALAETDLERMDSLARALRGEARVFELPLIVQRSEALERAIIDTRDPVAIRAALTPLLRACMAVRPAHG